VTGGKGNRKGHRHAATGVPSASRPEGPLAEGEALEGEVRHVPRPGAIIMWITIIVVFLTHDPGAGAPWATGHRAGEAGCKGRRAAMTQYSPGRHTGGRTTL